MLFVGLVGCGGSSGDKCSPEQQCADVCCPQGMFCDTVNDGKGNCTLCNSPPPSGCSQCKHNPPNTCQ